MKSTIFAFSLFFLHIVKTSFFRRCLVVIFTAPYAELGNFFRWFSRAEALFGCGPLVAIYFFYSIFFFASPNVFANTKPNVLLITIDSLRPDHMGAYGYPLATTPNIDKIAEEGTLFDNAFTQGGWTSPAMVSIFTSMYPSVHGVEARPDHFPCSKNSLLKGWTDTGYQMPGVAKVIKEKNFSHLGFAIQGDYVFDFVSLKNWIKNNKSSPFFVWYHINKTPHLPYNPPKPFDTLFLPESFSLTPAIEKVLERIKKNKVIPKGSLKFQKEDIVPIKALYDGEVRMADKAVQEIYALLAEENILDNTILIITADHGDELLDHGFIGHASTNHGGTLYEEIIHVPLIFRYPLAFPAGSRVDEIVEAIDILPTLIDITGIPGNQWVQGKSLLKFFQENKSSWENVAFSENSLCGFQCRAENISSKVRLASMRSSRWKFIARHEPGISKFELYDLQNDPGEKKNLISEHPETAKNYKERLLNWYHENSVARKALLKDCLEKKN